MASIQNSHGGNSGSSTLSLAGSMDRSGEIFSRSIIAEFIYWIADRHSGLPNVLSISMARCVLAQRIPTVGIWRYVVDVPGSVNRSGGQIALYKTGSLHSYWAAGVWHLPAYVCVYAWTSCPRYGIPTVGIFVCGRVRRCFWELPVPTISAKWRSWSCPLQSASLPAPTEKDFASLFQLRIHTYHPSAALSFLEAFLC